MEEVRGVGGPWTVASDPRDGGGKGVTGGIWWAKWTRADRWKDRDEGRLEEIS